MLLVPATVQASPIHGQGLFAAAPIRAGTVVSVWCDDEDTTCAPEEVDEQEPLIRALWRHYGYVDRMGLFRLAFGPERHINHTLHPNLGGDPTRFRIALRDISPGEELTEDYGVHEPNFPGFQR